MNRKTTYLSVIAVAIGSFISTTDAQTTTSALPAEILACADEVDVMRRLSCYDREVAAARMPSEAPPDAPAAPQPVAETPLPIAEPAPAVPDASVPAEVTPVAAPVAATATVAEVFEAAPVPDTSKANAQPPPQSSGGIDDFGYDRPLEEVTATVVEIRERPYGELIIRLDNGQVWEQKHLDRRFRLSVGETVTVKKGPVAGYRLSGKSNRSIQVERIK